MPRTGDTPDPRTICAHQSFRCASIGASLLYAWLRSGRSDPCLIPLSPCEGGSRAENCIWDVDRTGDNGHRERVMVIALTVEIAAALWAGLSLRL